MPEFVTLPFTEDGDIKMPERPLSGINTKLVVEAKAVSEEELMLPELVTIVPTNMAEPEEVIEPWLVTEP